MRIEEYILSSICSKSSSSIICDNGKEYTGDQLINSINIVKEKLRDLVLPGSRVGLIIDNGIDFVSAIFAVLSLKASLVLIDSATPEKSILINLRNANTNLVITSKETNKLLNTLEWRTSLINSSFYVSEKIDKSECLNELNDEAFIFFSSGTTGVAKGIILTHSGIIHNIKSIISYMQPNSNDNFYILRTLVYVSSLIGELFVALKAGAKIIIMNSILSPFKILSVIDQHKVTIIGVNPTILNLLVRAGLSRKYKLNSIRYVFVSGATVKKQLLIDAENIFPKNSVFNVYGLTEAGFRVTAQRMNQLKDYGSAGYPLENVKIKIINSKGGECPFLEIGEIYVNTPSVMKGYLDSTFCAGNKVTGNWLKTNDLGYIDFNGQLFITGRKDEMINRGGFNIDPNMVENIISDYPGILECIVFGITDKTYGEKVICIYTTSKQHKINITHNILYDYCRNYLRQIEVPELFIEWDYLPKTNSGKISRILIKKKFEAVNC